MTDAHPGDAVLKPLLKRFDSLYGNAEQRTEEIFAAFLKPRLKALERSEDETSKAYAARLMAVFSGPKWILTRRRIAKAFTATNDDATGGINEGLEEAFAVGLNAAAFGLAMTGVWMLPITTEIVSTLASEHVISLKKRKLNRKKDRIYNEQRMQSAVHAAVFLGVALTELPKHVAASMSHGRKNEMTAAARASIYGASDQGAFFAGLEAEAMGVEVEKTWLAIMDIHVRPSHSNLHGDTIPLHEKFKGLYGELRFPHDPEAPPQETYHCRCRMVVHVAGKSPGEYSRFILPTETSAYRKWRDWQIAAAGGELELLKKHKKLVS